LSGDPLSVAKLAWRWNKGKQRLLGVLRWYKTELAAPEKICLTLVVSTRKEVDQWHTKLTKLGVTCMHAPSYRPEFHIYNAFFRDPTNYTVEIQAFDSEYAPQ